ncbi:MAG: carbohydrate kinase family protein [Acidobacteria bacterium]|nr:carbohydrate kinase family protein [Acidobacteriota bacterium]
MELLEGVLCAGNVVFDILVRPVDCLEWNTTVWVDSLQQTMGGNGANTSYALGKLGTPVRLLSLTGCDEFGGQLLARLRGAGVDISRVSRAQGPTATTIAVVNSKGDRIFLHRVGAGRQAFMEPVDFTPEMIAGFSHFHLANPFALPGLRQHSRDVLERARAAGLTTSLDTGWDSCGRWIEDIGPCLPYTDLLFANEDEALMLAGAGDASEAARKLRGFGAGVVIMKLGSRGCGIYTDGAETRVPAFDVLAVDTTGAGDCFAGGFLAALHRSRSLVEAGRFANAVGALSIQELGATLGVRTYEETEAWMSAARIRG